MDRSFYLDLAERGVAFPIGADLVVREHADADAIMNDGARLGEAVAKAARRYRTPLAIPLMDLMLEQNEMLALLGLGGSSPDTFHFETCPDESLLQRLKTAPPAPITCRMQATVDAIKHVHNDTGLVPVGMCIGPYSLMTKLLAEPITPIYFAGAGATGDDEPEVLTVERVLEMATVAVLRSVQSQIDAGAKAIMVAEPAASNAYISPKQIEQGSDIYERFPMAANRRVRQLMQQHGVDLLFHCCGELVEPMVRAFGSLDPAILSLGSSRKLWEDAAVVPKTTVLYGNLPSKKFYSDDLITLAQVRELIEQLKRRMRDVAHPFILGSECDVLHVAGCEAQIGRKVRGILDAAPRPPEDLLLRGTDHE